MKAIINELTEEIKLLLLNNKNFANNLFFQKSFYERIKKPIFSDSI